MSKISWTDATWNPVTGCTKVSPGCAYCYIERTPPMRMAGRKFVDGKIPVTLHPDRLGIPLRWRKPRRVFVCSMSDLFHEDVPDGFISQVWGKMYASPAHTFQVLTKRPERMHRWLERCGDGGRLGWMTLDAEEPKGYRGSGIIVGGGRWPLPNVWLGVTAENQKAADERIPILLDTPAAVRLVSAEPLLGPLELEDEGWLQPETDAEYVPHVFESNLDRTPDWRGPGAYCRHCGNREPNGLHRAEPRPLGILRPGLDWVIAGGESGGPPERALVDRCWHDDGGFLGEEHHGLQHLGPGRVKGSYHWCPKPEALAWVRSLRDQCAAAGVPFHFKQWGPRAGQGTLVDSQEHKEMP